MTGRRKLWVAHVLAVFLGFFGAHHFYLRRHGFGALYLCTGGLFGLGYLVDLFRTPLLVRVENERYDRGRVQHPRLLSDAYLLWLPPFGLLGAHHIYFQTWDRKYIALYGLTFGYFGLGWLLDFPIVPWWKDHSNAKHNLAAPNMQPDKELEKSYALCVFPLTGVLGLHHLYLGRRAWCMWYVCTLGHFGLGWLLDIVRMRRLVTNINKNIGQDTLDLRLHLSDAYLVWLPLGLFGAHHYYLKRSGWFIAYITTCGIFGIGWLIDLFRLPYLVREHNRKYAAGADARQGSIQEHFNQQYQGNIPV